MSKKIRIVGAGSIGNHLAQASRRVGWHVTLTDTDPEALRRSKDDIYPARYGSWDDAIDLKLAKDGMDEPVDVVYVGTPPDSHLAIANQFLDLPTPPRALVIEKPLSGPDLTGWDDFAQRCAENGVFGAVGYNHCLGENTAKVDALIQSGHLGTLQTISTKTREHWQGIFDAHPWLAGPQDSYLGFASRGGGATGEHSHAINIWQHFAHLAGCGRVVEVSATLDWIKSDAMNYDQAAFVSLTTESGLVGDVVQDVVTRPTEKAARLQGEDGFLTWEVGAGPGLDMVTAGGPGKETQSLPIEKTRADDFHAVTKHLDGLLDGSIGDSPIALARGLETLVVIAAIFKSDREGRRVKIDWSKGYTLEALN